MDEYRRPAEAFPVATFVIEEMNERGWSRTDLARKMCKKLDIKEFEVNYLALDFMFTLPDEPSLLLGEAMAEGLSHAFGTSAEIWLNLDKAYKDWLATTP